MKIFRVLVDPDMPPNSPTFLLSREVADRLLQDPRIKAATEEYEKTEISSQTVA
jgi:hypothetical protein